MAPQGGRKRWTYTAPVTKLLLLMQSGYRCLLGVLVFLFAGITPLCAQISSSSSGEGVDYDERVKRALDAEGWNYEIDDDGDFKLIVSFSDEGRSQLVYVISNTATSRNFEVREVWSPVYVSDDGPDQVPPDVLEWGLRRSWSLIVGSLAMAGDGTIYLVAKLAADASAEDLSSIIRLTASSGDELEKEKSSDDDL